MYYEVLALEVNASIAGLEVVKPATIVGSSGVVHRFSFLARDKAKAYGFDICPQVGEVELLRAFVKVVDTGAEVFVVCLTGRPSADASRLAGRYGIKVINPGDVGDFFSKRIARQIEAQRSTKS